MAMTSLLPHRKEGLRPFRSVAAATALVVLLGACGGTVHNSGASAPAPGGVENAAGPAPTGEIRIGMVYALSGPLGPNGRSMMEGFQGILSKINDEGGIGGAKFKFLVRDDQFDPSQSKRAIRELIAQKIWAFSGFTPALWLAAKDDLKAAGVLGFPFDVGAERQRTEPTSF